MELKKLKEPFSADDVEWRVGSVGETNGRVWATALCYVTNRAIMDRLDDVCGPENWKNHYDKAPDGGILCGLSIKVNGEWVTKWDGAESTKIEAVKGGLSGAMKRAGVQWGIGRYLYNLGKSYVVMTPNGKFSLKDKSNKRHKWDAPTLPGWALPPVNVSPENKEKQADLAYKLDIIMTENDLTDNDKKQMVKFYCISKKIPVVELHELNNRNLNNFTAKFYDVLNAFIKNIGA